jgi:hypothetical protein
MTDATMPAELAESPVGRQLAFFIGGLRGGAAKLTDEEVTATFVTEPPAQSAPVRRSVLAHYAAAIGPFSVRGYEPWRADFALALLEDARRRAWRAFVQIEASAPYRIRQPIATLALPPGITLRPAQPSDAAALRTLELRCSIVMGDVRVTYDRGDDYFAGGRLVGQSDPLVAERDGALVAVHCVLNHELRVSGLVCQAGYLHHTRILPAVQGGGVFSALQGAEIERNAHKSEILYSYVAVGNEGALKVVPVRSWSVRPERLVIDCRTQAGAQRGRGARVRDAQRIVALINAAHEREELFVPYTVERLATRLGREPAMYGWPHLLLAERAVVGVWPAGMRVLRETPQGRDESVRALVIDTGFAPGAEAELVALLRAWCGTLAGRGFTHLSLFTSPGSLGYEALRPLAARVEPYHFNIGLPEPPDVAARGLYVDHLYF